MINVDFKILVFISAARHLNFTRAAKEMNISQPAVSKNIQELESQAGRNLFERSGHRLGLTKAGALFLEHALKITAVYQNFNCELGLMEGILSGELRLGASTTLAHFILPDIIAAFHLAFPNITLNVLQGNTRNIEDFLINHTIDLGVVEGLSDNVAMKYETFLKDEIVLVTRRENPKIIPGQSIDTAQLLDLEFVLREQGSGTNDVIRRAVTNAGISWQDLHVKVHLASTESIKSFLRKTDCFSFLSVYAIHKEIQNGELVVVEVENLCMDRSFYFVRPHGVIGHLPEAFRRFSMTHYAKNGIFTPGE
ncbi:LysR substrate-binding domain-containing protein [Sphingobacterium shayense]|uniref:LysR substrate-binding domain-containing protein n=1 Tax=Sphingobacterium shayense TaxID=626343 RepID=UPI001FEA2DC8|nr:LysR substrate-binding domain-containing protein [Sphingobacterium shayense]